MAIGLVPVVLGLCGAVAAQEVVKFEDADSGDRTEGRPAAKDVRVSDERTGDVHI